MFKIKKFSFILLFYFILINFNIKENNLNNSLHADNDIFKGLFIRYLIGAGQGSIRDIADNPVTGTTYRSSFDMGGFAVENFALHLGLDYIRNESIFFSGKSDSITRRGDYYYTALTSGFTVFAPGSGIYVSLLGRFMVDSYYRLYGTRFVKNFIDSGEVDPITNAPKPLIDKSYYAEVPVSKGNFNKTTAPWGYEIIVGTNEWRFSRGVGLGIAFVYSSDAAPLKNNNFNVMFSVTYSK